MTTLQEWKKAKLEQIEFIVGLDEQRTFLDTSFDELLALIEAEVVPGLITKTSLDDDAQNYKWMGQNEARDKIKRAFSRLRGETNDQSVLAFCRCEKPRRFVLPRAAQTVTDEACKECERPVRKPNDHTP